MAGPPMTPWWERTLPQDECSYSRSESYSCKTTVDEKDRGGKSVRRCERIKTLLRHCPTKPTEVVESTSEITEEPETSMRLPHGLPSLPSLPSFLPPSPEGPSGEERIDLFFKDLFKATDDVLGQFGSKLEESANEALKGLFPREDEAATASGPGSEGDAERLNGWKRFLGFHKNDASEKRGREERLGKSESTSSNDVDPYKSFEQKFEEV